MISNLPEATTQSAALSTDFAVQLARRRHDPILEELWAIKAQINAEANYDLDRLAELARKAAAPYIDSTGRVRLPDTTNGQNTNSERQSD